jgi:murein DD-endopeptidase MepM/ murein hydrolase activator NlpD
MASPAGAGEGGVGATAPESAPPSSSLRQAYPVRGPHEYWDGFGAGRGHEGVDVGARCGTPLVASQAGRVRFVKYHARAGNYLVIDARNSVFDLAYMHLAEPASVKVGQNVAAGQLVGLVGDTGNASGCHLHFELWEGAYYGGGAPIDPMPYLLSLDRERKRAKRAR